MRLNLSVVLALVRPLAVLPSLRVDLPGLRVSAVRLLQRVVLVALRPGQAAQLA